MDTVVRFLVILFVSFSSLAQAEQCSSFLKSQQLPQARQETLPLELSTEFSGIAKDMVIDNFVLTNKLFVAALMKALENRGFDVRSSYASEDGIKIPTDEGKKEKLKSFELNLKKASEKIDAMEIILSKIGENNLFLIAKETLLIVEKLIDESQQKTAAQEFQFNTEFDETLGKVELEQTRYYLTKYQHQKSSIIDGLTKLYKNNYIELVSQSNTLTSMHKNTHYGIDQVLTLMAGGGSLVYFISWELGHLAFLSTHNPFAGFLATFVPLIPYVFGFDYLNKFWNRFKAKKRRPLITQIAAKSLLSAGLIDGQVIDATGTPVETHPMVESDGVVSQITNVDALQSLLQTLEPLPTLDPQLSKTPDSEELLTFGDHLDKSKSKVANLLFDRWKDFITFMQDFPQRLNDFNKLISDLKENNTDRKNPAHITRLRDYAEDFAKTQQSVLITINILEHLVTYTQNIVDQYQKHQETMRSYKEGLDSAGVTLNPIRQGALLDRIESLHLHYLTTVTVAQNYTNLATEALLARRHLDSTSIMSTQIESLIASGFNPDQTLRLTSEIEALTKVFEDMSAKLETSFREIQESPDLQQDEG